MSAVSIAGAWPAAGRPFTTAELDRMPDDGHRYELLDGVLVVSPRPTVAHQVMAHQIAFRLEQVCPPEYRVVPEPAVQLSMDTEFDPDIVVIRLGQARGAKLTEPPLLVVEVRSPATALIDLNRKKAAYARFGVESYWIADPDLARPSLTAFGLRGGGYEQMSRVAGEEIFRAERPYPVDIVPAQLVAGLPCL